MSSRARKVSSTSPRLAPAGSSTSETTSARAKRVVCKVLKVDPGQGPHRPLPEGRERAPAAREDPGMEERAEGGEPPGIVAQRLDKTVDACWDEFGYDLLDSFGTLYRAFEESVMESMPSRTRFQGSVGEDVPEVARETSSATCDDRRLHRGDGLLPDGPSTSVRRSRKRRRSRTACR